MKVKRLKKNSTTLLRRTSALIASFSLSLVQFSTVANGNALLNEAQQAMSGNSGSELTNAATSIFQGVTQMANQMGQANQMQGTPEQIQAWNILQQDSRKHIGNDNMGAIRHFMFPNCLVPPDKTAKPMNLCSPEAPDFMVNDMMRIGQDYMNMYKKYVGGAQNTAAPLGMQCIDNSIKSLEDAAKTSLGELEKMMNQFDALRKEFENAQQVPVKNMRDLHAELNGGGNSQDFKNKDYTTQFPKECNDLLSGQLNAKAKTGGLVSLQNDFISKDSKAANFRGQSLNQVKQQLTNDKKKISKLLKERGLTALSSTVSLKGLTFAPLFKEALTQVLAPINENIGKANAIISELGVQDKVPDLTDPSFEVKLDSVLEKAQTSYKDKFILDCMRGDNSVAYSSSIKSVIGKFDNRITSGQGATLREFKKKAPGLIGSAQTVGDLESSINVINNNDIKIQVTNSKNEAESKTLSQYYFDLKNECSNIYEGRLAPANGDTAALNYKKRADQAKKEIENIKKDISKVLASKDSSSTFGSVEQAIDEMVMNCNGQVVTSNSCSEDAFDTSKGNFCLKRASTCSNQINACKTVVSEYVNDRTNRLKVAADLHNKAVSDLEAKANILVGNMNTLAENMSKSLHAKLFPAGIPAELRAMYGIPTNSGFAIPEAVKPINMIAQDAPPFNGILLKGLRGGKLDLKELETQIQRNVKALKNELQGNIESQLSRAADMASSNQDTWKNELEKWTQIIEGCQNTIAQKKQAIAEQNKLAQENAAKNKEAQTMFCRKMVAFATGPGCKGTYSVADLYEESMEISHLIGADVFGALGEYDRLCGTNQSEDSEEEEESLSDKKIAALEDICDQATPANNEELTNYIRENYLDNNMPAEFEEYKDDVKKYLANEKTSNEFKELIADGTHFGVKLKALKAIYAQIADTDDTKKQNICKEDRSKLTAAIDECKEQKPFSEKEKCEKSAKEKYSNSEDKQVIGAKILRITNIESGNNFSKIGENYGGTSCAAIAGTSKPKSMFQNNSPDFADIFSQGAFYR